MGDSIKFFMVILVKKKEKNVCVWIAVAVQKYMKYLKVCIILLSASLGEGEHQFLSLNATRKLCYVYSFSFWWSTQQSAQYHSGICYKCLTHWVGPFKEIPSVVANTWLKSNPDGPVRQLSFMLLQHVLHHTVVLLPIKYNDHLECEKYTVQPVCERLA